MMLSSGKISQATFTKVKDGFELLQDTLKSAQSSEMQLLGEAKRCQAELERLQVEVRSPAEQRGPPEEPDGEVSKLRRQLLQAHNELRAAEDREHAARHGLQRLREEKQHLEREIQTQPACILQELESNTDMLKDKHDALKKEVAQRQLDVSSLESILWRTTILTFQQTLTEDLETLETLLLKEQKELEEKMEIIEIKEAEKAQLACIPKRIIQETERKRSLWEVAMKKMDSLNTELSETKHQMRSLNEGNQSLEVMREEVMQELERLGALIAARQLENRQLLKKQEICREESSEVMGSRGILEMKLHNLMTDRKQLYESRSLQLRKKNKQVEALRRMEHGVSMATEQLACIQSVYKSIQSQVLDAVPEREASARQRMELEKEIDALAAGFEKQVSMAEEENQKKHQNEVIQELLKESNHLREELHNLRCLRQIKAEERSKKHWERLKAEQLSERIHLELRERELIIMDHNKLNAVLQRRISQYSKLCDKFLEEKNKYVRLKQIASQTTSELTEQLNILENEMEIQRSTADSKDRLLIKARMKVSSSSKMREKLRNEISKFTWKRHQVHQQHEDNKLELMNLTQMIKFHEGILLEVKRSLENAIQRRNFLGIRLLEQDKVLSNFYEQMKNLEAAVAKSNRATETVEKHVRELQIEINDEKKQIDLEKRKVLLKRKLEEEIIVLQIELSEARDATLKSVTRTLEYRELKGDDPPTPELVKKMEQLEVNLAERERQLLEKEHLVERVTRMSKPLGEQAESCRVHSLSVAKKLNEARAKIVNINLCLMAVSAELSVKQAAALSEHRQMKEREQQLSEARDEMMESVGETNKSEVEASPLSELDDKTEQLSEARDEMMESVGETNKSEVEASPPSELDDKTEQLSEGRDKMLESVGESNESEVEASPPSELDDKTEQLPERESQQQPEGEGAEQEAGPSKPPEKQAEILKLHVINSISKSRKKTRCRPDPVPKVPMVPWYFDVEEIWRRIVRDRRLRQREREEKKRRGPPWLDIDPSLTSGSNQLSPPLSLFCGPISTSLEPETTSPVSVEINSSPHTHIYTHMYVLECQSKNVPLVRFWININ
ncbi:coiled-coil domain-containing protein 146 isoform X4 [Gambusia affinis]|uniref:coiled-coil domain-containing protein 146 isoform X4 n=1 Tax=Gambusia affinis TaxID=33528 RepID=UPI001CDC5DAA|nr:coiled-coil domain-containing protein 146 isoform X4 [Gambusia affinis]